MKIVAIAGMALVIFTGGMSFGQGIPWEDPDYARDIPATHID